MRAIRHEQRDTKKTPVECRGQARRCRCSGAYTQKQPPILARLSIAVSNLCLVGPCVQSDWRVLPGQNAVRVNLPRSVASLSAKDEPKQLKRGLKRRLKSPRAMWMLRFLAKWFRRANSPRSGMFRPAGSRSGYRKARSSPTRGRRGPKCQDQRRVGDTPAARCA